jgi:hypothetical protein
LEPILPLDSAEVFFDGIFSEPRLRHPERIAIDADGDIWCGGETAEIYGISADGSGIETVASTGGFILGLAFDDEQNLYACDMHHSAVFRLEPFTHAPLQSFSASSSVQREESCSELSSACGYTSSGSVGLFGMRPSSSKRYSRTSVSCIRLST